MKSPKDQWIVQIDITNACVHKCSNCTRFCGFHKKPYFMDYEYFCRAVDSLIDRPGMIGIMGGEPTLHPRFIDICNYVYEKLPEERRAHNNLLKYPTDSFMEARRRVELEQFEIHKFGDGYRPIVQGVGLWTSMTRQYRQYYETIQDVFNYQNLNDHNNASYHQPVLISRKEMNIDDETWLKLRDTCWVNQEWSGSITPKGCFFCEVAGSLDMLMDGPGGLPLEKDWWKRPIEDYKDQFHWCEICGIPLKTFARDAREGVTDISRDDYEMLTRLENVKLDKNGINVVDIHDGQFSKENTKDTAKYHGAIYIENIQSRVSDQTKIYAGEFIGVLIITNETEGEYEKNLKHNLQYLEKVYVVRGGKVECVVSKDGSKIQIEDRIISIGDVKKLFGNEKYIVLMTAGISLAGGFNILKKCAINPGTIHYIEYKAASSGNPYIGNGSIGKCLLMSTFAKSVANMPEDTLVDLSIFEFLLKKWNRNKRIYLDSRMDKLMYEVGEHKYNPRLLLRRTKDAQRFLRKSFFSYGIVKTVYLIPYFFRKYGVSLMIKKILRRMF